MNGNNTPDREMSGRTIVPSIGSANIIVGANAEATEATAFLKTAFVPTLAADIGFAFTAFPSSSWTDIPDFSTQASGSVWLIRGRNTGRVPGTRPTTFTSTTSVMAITCTTGAIPESLLPSTSRSNRQPEIP